MLLLLHKRMKLNFFEFRYIKNPKSSYDSALDEDIILLKSANFTLQKGATKPSVIDRYISLVMVY